jgi:hypothetical protein
MTFTEEQMNQIVTTMNSAIDDLEKVGEKITAALEICKCKQLQMIAVDLSSIADHIQDFATNGPAEPWAEIPLEQSETSEAL